MTDRMGAVPLNHQIVTVDSVEKRDEAWFDFTEMRGQ